jgi:predicted dehydrogenase
MKTVRLGIIGLGNIGQHHFGYLTAGKVSRAELVAVSDAVPSKLDRYLPLKTFTDGEKLIRSGLVDAVIIATPHYQHTTLGIAALKQGLHVMVEKPISAHKADAERLIATHKQHPKQVFAGMFQLRAEPRYLKIQKLIQTGELGEIVRMSWIMTDWFRTEAYYASGGWRATWKGEGGGVLLNQCLHNLDAMQWLLGMPARVRGFCNSAASTKSRLRTMSPPTSNTATAPPAPLSPPRAKLPAPTALKSWARAARLCSNGIVSPLPATRPT